MPGHDKNRSAAQRTLRCGALAVLAGTSLVAPACSTLSDLTGLRTQASPAAAKPARPAPAAQAPMEQRGHGIAYATDRPAPKEPIPAPPRKNDATFDESSAPVARPASLVGLYGELLSEPNPATGRFDGAGNLAQITAVTEGACFDPDVDRSGALLVYASTQHRRTSDIYLKSATGRTQRQITSDPGDDVMPAFAPDGERIAFASSRYGNWDIFITDLNGAPAMPITDSAEQELHPTWSSDGRMIAYCRFGVQSGRWEIWCIDLANHVHQFLDYGLFPHWNPDPARNKIVFQRARERGSRFFSLWTIDYINGEALHPTEILSAANAAVMHPTWSPDGKRIVFVTVVDPNTDETGRPGQSDIWLVNHDGSGRLNLTNGNDLNLYPVWSPDGTVYFLSNRSGTDNIWAVATGRTIELSPINESGLASSDPAMEQHVTRP